MCHFDGGAKLLMKVDCSLLVISNIQGLVKKYGPQLGLTQVVATSVLASSLSF